MADTFDSKDTQLSQVLGELNKGNIQLPDFQRGWVWDDYRIKALIASVVNGYPIGALMFLEYGGDSVRFKYRPFTGAQVDCVPEILVLDGQQRLTSMFNAFYCKTPVPTKTDKGKAIDRYYYISIKDYMDDEFDTLDAIISIPADRMIKTNFDRDVVFDLSDREKEYSELAFPLNIAFDAAATLTWINECKQFHGYSKTEIMQLLDSFNLCMTGDVQGYRVPVITLGKEVPKEAVCQVFENVNTGGVGLTVFELVTATFAADDFDLRADWEGSEKDGILGRHQRLVKASNILKNVSSTDFLTALTLMARYYESLKPGGRAVSCKKKDVLALQLDSYNEYADKLEEGLIKASYFLKEQRIFDPRDLPYTTQLIPLSVFFALLDSRAQDAPVRKKIAQWYWCGVLGEMYGGANETRYVNDVNGMMKWVEKTDEVPETIARAFFQPTRLLSLQTRNSAAYKGIMALILKHGAVDFVSGVAMDFTNFTDQKVDIHHVFPQDYCIKQSYPRVKWNSIVNKTPLAASTNRMIGGVAPSKYMEKIEKDDHVTEDSLDRHIETHAIDPMYLRCDDFDGFIVERAKSLVGMIGDAMGKPVPNLAGEDVVEAFGEALE